MFQNLESDFFFYIGFFFKYLETENANSSNSSNNTGIMIVPATMDSMLTADDSNYLPTVYIIFDSRFNNTNNRKTTQQQLVTALECS
jgi:hypothetical protein